MAVKAKANGLTVASVNLKFDKRKIAEMSDFYQAGLFRMGYDIHNKAKMLAPVLTSALQNSIRVEEDGYDVYVVAGGRVGGKEIRYAAIRELVNNAHPWTAHYMENAMNTVMTGDYLKKYFGGI